MRAPASAENRIWAELAQNQGVTSLFWKKFGQSLPKSAGKAEMTLGSAG
jgi:hypothetical protein